MNKREFKVGARVKAKTTDLKGAIGEITSVRQFDPFPIVVKWYNSNSRITSLATQELELIDETPIERMKRRYSEK